MPTAKWFDFLLGILGNFAFAILLAVTAVLYLRYARRAQRLFMGLNSKTPNLRIFVSRLKIKEGGALAVEGQAIKKGFMGEAINRLEYQGALVICGALRSRLSEDLQDFVLRVFHRSVGFDARIEICPERWGQPGLSNDATLVFLGSQIYNSGTYHYVQQRTDILKNVSFHRQPETGVRFLRVNSGGHLEGWYSPYGAHVGVQDMPVLAPELVASEPKTDFGFIQRINERIGQNEQRTVFVCAGLGAAATLACADYLGKSWRKIYKQCGTHEFQLLLRLDNQNPNEIPSAEPKVGFIAPNY